MFEIFRLNNRSYLYKKHKQGCDVNMSAEFLSCNIIIISSEK